MVTSSANLWTAASDGDLERVKHLIEQEGMSVNAKDNNGYSALHAAVSWAHPTLLRYLLSKGGDINLTDNDGDTPLFTVESLEMCKLVLELGGDPHLHNEAGQTAAQSLQEEHPEISEFLCTLTGEKLPERLAQDEDQADTSATAEQVQATALAYQNAQPPEDILNLDPASRQAAIETNQRAGDLLSRVQAILLEADETGEDPEERIREVVNEAVQSTMRAGQQIAEMQAKQAEQASAAQVEAASGEDSAAKRRRDEEPGR